MGEDGARWDAKQMGDGDKERDGCRAPSEEQGQHAQTQDGGACLSRPWHGVWCLLTCVLRRAVTCMCAHPRSPLARGTSRWQAQGTPLHFAAVSGKPDCVRALCEAGAAVSQEADGGFTPLHASAHAGHIESARLLSSYGARAAHAPELAAHTGHHELSTWLQQALATVKRGIWKLYPNRAAAEADGGPCHPAPRGSSRKLKADGVQWESRLSLGPSSNVANTLMELIERMVLYRAVDLPGA